MEAEDLVRCWVLVTSSRDVTQAYRPRVRSALVAVQEKRGLPGWAMGMVHGAARGGDLLFDSVARDLGWCVLPDACTDAEWRRYGNAAGHRRNGRMVQRHRAVPYAGCVALPLGLSAGTRGCMVLAEDAGIRVWNVGEPAIADGLYRVEDQGVCAAFLVRRGVVEASAPILRKWPRRRGQSPGGLGFWWRLVVAGDPRVCLVEGEGVSIPAGDTALVTDGHPV